MTSLSHIWTDTAILPSWAQQDFNGFCLDSRKVEKGQIFIALQGLNNDVEKTQAYIDQALSQEALGVLTEVELSEQDHVLYVPQLRRILGQLQQSYLQAVQQQSLARAVAVTGTNGKTTVSRLIAELLTLLGHPTAVMGTTGNGILPNLEASTHTTLDALQFQQAYYNYSQQGAEFLSLEASSHGLEQGRVANTPIEVAAFTNLSRDHLDYHGTLENYAKAKSQLFDFSSLQHAVINADADFADLMIERATYNIQQPKVWRFSTTDQTVEYAIEELSFSLQGARFILRAPTGRFEVNSPLLGRFNVENILAAIISTEKLGFDLEKIISLVPKLQGAPGRMQVIEDQNRLFIVDYAHTPDALIQVLTSLEHHKEKKLWAVFGCGGDRDRGKRPLMTQAALDHADKVILTSDNPRTEDLDQIFSDMVQEVDLTPYDVKEIRDRREAIKYAVAHAEAGDIVVIAGKGHENYQEIDGVRHWFDDVVEVKGAIDGQGSEQVQTYPAE